MYQLKSHPQVSNHLRQVPPKLKRQVSEEILDLQDEPRPDGAEELRDHYAGIWKIKVDGWRIFYQIFEEEQTVMILGIKRRTAQTYTSMYDG